VGLPLYKRKVTGGICVPPGRVKSYQVFGINLTKISWGFNENIVNGVMLT